MSIDQHGGDSAAEHPVTRFAHRANAVLDGLVDAATWSLTADQTRQSLLDLTRLQQRVAELRLRVLAVADSLDVGADTGCTSTAAWLAEHTRVTRARAHADVALARALSAAHVPTREALAAGALHEDQARVVVAAIEDLPDEVSSTDRARAEEHLVLLAREHDAQSLRRLGRRVFEVIAPEETDRREGEALARQEARARRRTSLRMHDNGDGTWSGLFRIPDLHAAMLRKAVQALVAPRQHGAPTPEGAAAFTTAQQLGTGFTLLLERFPVDRLPRAGGVNASVVVTMTLDQLRSGLGAAGVDTGGWISAGEARRLACGAGVIPAVLGGRSEVLDLGRRRRFHSAPQRLAMALQSDGCTVVSCDRPAAWCEAHHELPWSDGGTTSVRDGRLLCRKHHRLAHDEAFDMTRLPTGQVRFHRRT